MCSSGHLIQAGFGHTVTQSKDEGPLLPSQQEWHRHLRLSYTASGIPVLKKADYESHAASATLPSQGEKKIDLQLPMGFDLDGETLAETHCNLLLTAQFSFRLPQRGVS